MTTTITAQIGTSDWHLAGIRTSPGGETCDHCPRTLKYLYDVTNTKTGQTKTVGRGCCKKVTGWTLAASEAARILRAAENRAKRDAVWAEFSAAHPELAAPIDTAVSREDDPRGREQAFGFKSDISECPYPDVRVRWAARYLAEFAH